MVPKSGHVTITYIENLHIAHVEKFTDSKNAILFYLWRKITKLSQNNRFRTVASPSACERLAKLAVLNWRSSSIHPSSYYYRASACRACYRCCPSSPSHCSFASKLYRNLRYRVSEGTCGM